MKTTASKENSTPSQSSQPFFNKKGEGSFWVQTKEAEQPFFAPDISRQAAAEGGHNFANIPIFSPSSQPVIQTKLTINEPGDKYEQEADAMADRVMRMTSAPPAGNGELPQTDLSTAQSLQRKCATCHEEEKIQREEMDNEEPLQRKEIGTGGFGGSGPIDIQRKCATCEAEDKVQRQEIEEETIQRAGNTEGSASEGFSSQLSTTKGSGQSLPREINNSMGSAMDADFSNVRIHTDRTAAEMSQSIQARAFTHGNDVYFNEGNYNPNSTEGRRLLAHELVHTMQQGRMQRKIQKKGFESIISICHRVLTSRIFHVSNGGVRVALQIYSPDTEIVDCENHDFYLTLTRQESWWRSDQEISNCKVRTGKDSVVQIGGLPTGDYYFTIWRTFDHPYCCVEGDIQVYDENIPAGVSDCTKIRELSTMDIVHGALDIAGFIPVLGAIPDGVNAIIYVGEGDWANAGISVVAMIPAFGDGAKAAVMGGKTIIKVSEKTALKLGEEGMAKALKEAKAAHAAEEASKLASKAEKEALEKAEKEAAEKLLKEEIKECEAIWLAYKALDCKGCKGTDTKAELTAKILCLTTLIPIRQKYLSNKCDYILPGSLKRGSAIAEKGHQEQVDGLIKALAKCSKFLASL